MTPERKILGGAALLTVLVLVVWQATGGDAYTKFIVVERVERDVPAGDLLGEAGFYDDQPQIETQRRREFRLGLLPTPAGLLDKHWISVTVLAGAAWILAIGALWWKRRRSSRSALATVPAADRDTA